MERNNQNQINAKMKTVNEIMYQIWGYTSEPECRILKEWADSIVDKVMLEVMGEEGEGSEVCQELKDQL